MAMLYASEAREWIKLVSQIAQQTAAVKARDDIPFDVWSNAMKVNHAADALLNRMTFALVRDVEVDQVPAADVAPLAQAAE